MSFIGALAKRPSPLNRNFHIILEPNQGNIDNNNNISLSTTKKKNKKSDKCLKMMLLFFHRLNVDMTTRINQMKTLTPQPQQVFTILEEVSYFIRTDLHTG